MFHSFQRALKATTLLILCLFASYAAFAQKTWVAPGASGNWSNPANWSPAGVPGVADNVIFNASSTANCVIDQNVNIISLTINGYNSTITNTNFTINILTGTYSQASGTFNGGSGTISISPDFFLTGGTFNSTSGTLQVRGSNFSVTGGIFNANGGKVRMVDNSPCPSQCGMNIIGNITFCKLEYGTQGFPGTGHSYIVANTLTVQCEFISEGGSPIFPKGGTIDILGDIYTNNTENAGDYSTSTTQFNISGTGTQNWFGQACLTPTANNTARGRLVNVTINKAPTDTLYIYGMANISRNYTYVSGVLKTFGFLSFVGPLNISGSPHTISRMGMSGSTITINAATVLTCDTTLLFSRINPVINTGTINVTGDMVLQSFSVPAGFASGGGTATVNIVGNRPQTMYCNSPLASGTFPNVVINCTSLNITRSSWVSASFPCLFKSASVNNYASVAGNWTYTAGALTGDGIICFNGATNQINNTHTLPNVAYYNDAFVQQNKTVASGVLTARDTLFTHGTGPLGLFGNTDVLGSLVSVNTGGANTSTGTITMKGTGTHSMTSTYSSFAQPNGLKGFLPNIIIDMPSGTLNIIDTHAVQGNWTVLDGNVVGQPGSNVFLHRNNLNLDMQGSVTGTQSFFDLTLVGTVNRNLTGNVGVTGKFNLDTARVTLNTFTFSMNSNNPANLVRINGYVISENPPGTGYGRFEWAIGTAAAGNTFLYPFGTTAGTYIPFTFEVQSAGIGSGKLSVATYPTDWTVLPNNRPFPTGVSNINNILGADNYGRELDRFWIPEATSYSTAPTARLTFTYRDIEWNLPQNNIVETRLEAHRWLPSTTAWQLPNSTSTRNTTNNTVTIPNQNTFTPFTIVDPELPDLRISSSDTVVCLGTPINFFDLNVPTPQNSQWFFPGATTPTSTATNPTGILYTTLGCKDVILEATYAGGVLRDTFPCFITIVDAPVVSINKTDVTCNGQSNGKVWVTVPGAGSAFTYQWSGGAPTVVPDSVRTGLAAGPYTVTVSNSSGCPTTVTTTVIEPTAVNATLASSAGPLCNNGTNGAATINVSGGTGPTYTFTWNGTAAPATRTDLTAGNYEVIVTDVNGCKDTVNFTLSNPAALGLTVAKTDVSCFGGNNGKVWATVTGGTPNITYAWTPNTGSVSANGDTSFLNVAGPVSVLVTDGNGCTVTGSTTVGQPAAAITVLKGQTNVACNAGTTGKVWARASGGSTPYTYTWSPITPPAVVTGANGDTLTNLTAGVYFLTTTDANGCIKLDTFVLTQPTAITVAKNVTQVSCFGGTDGAITLTPSGGPATPPNYTYTWQRNGTGIAPTTNSITGLNSGTYTAIINKGGCLAFDTTLITQPNAIVLVPDSVSITCFNGNDGEVSVAASGGTGPNYTYDWTLGGTSVGNTATVTGRGPGNYQVIVTDQNGCKDTAFVSLANPQQLGINTGSDDVACFGICDGKAWATLSGGTGAGTYTYIWTGGIAGDTLFNACAGSYGVTGTDGNGCTVSATVTVNSPIQIATNISGTNVTCFGGNDGEVAVTYTGGPPTPNSITYTWLQDGAIFPNNNTATVSGVEAGEYTVTINIDGCLALDTIDITEPTEIVATITATNLACAGDSSGTATVTHTGGPVPDPTFPRYRWERNGTLLTQTTATINNLPEGTYTVIVNVNGCFGFDTIVITEPVALTSTITGTDPNCNNGTAGSSVTVTPNGGTPGPGYTYVWTLDGGPIGATTATASGFGAGAYQVIVTDANGCADTASYTLNNPAAITLTMTGTDASCFGVCDGEAGVVANGGTPIYTYGWSNGATTQNITALCPGWYRVTVTDQQGCFSIDSVEVLSPPQIATTITSDSVSCFGLNDGSATVSYTGGPATPTSVTYTWLQDGNTFPNNNAALVSGLTAGEYTVTIDIDGCLAFDTIEVGQPAEIVANLTGTDLTCFGDSSGTVTATYTGGPIGPTASYIWEYNFNTITPTTAALTNLPAGTYSVSVQVGACFGFDTLTINQPAALSNTITGTDPACNGGTAGSTVTVTPSGGNPGPGGYTYTWTLDGGPISANTATASGFGAGIYEVIFSDVNGCADTATFTLNNPPAIVITKDSFNVKCFGDATGKAWVTVSGGTPGPVNPYIITWGAGNVVPPGDTIINLLAGTYPVEVEDGRACIVYDTFRITQPAALGVTLATDSVSCFGGSDGKVWATAQGGSGSYTFDWIPVVAPPAVLAGANGDTVLNVSSLVYTVTVTDDSSCATQNSITIPQPPALTLSHDSTNILCFGDATGKAWVTATGGRPGYTYNWGGAGTPTGNGDTITNLVAGTYPVTVTDDNGCEAFDTVIVTQPTAPLTLAMDSTNVSCFGGNNGKAWVTVTGGTTIFGSYNYSWNGGIPIGLQDTIINLTARTYILTVTDSNNCVAVDSVQITQPPLLTLTKDSTNVLCFGDSTGKAWVTPVGGVGAYNNVTWTGPTGTPSGALNDTLNNLSTGTYVAAITDTNNCSATATFTITQPTQLVLNMFHEDVNCFGDSTARAWVVVTGGTPGVNPPYTYAWSGGTQAGAGDTVIGLWAGTFTVTVTDGNGCTDTNTVTILQPAAPLSVTMDSLNIACFGQTTGKAWATAAGGTGPYTYTWLPAATTSGTNGDTIINLAAGVYRVTITDNLGCTVEDSVNIIEPPLLTVNVDSIDILCAGQTTGTAWATVTGGTPGFNYNWSRGNQIGIAGDTVNNLAAGLVSVTVTDNNGCIAVDSTVINEPAPLTITIDSLNVSCNGANDGRAWVTASGGVGNYTYSWNPPGNPTNATGDTITNLTPGIYVVTVNDGNNCTVINAVTIEEPNLLLGNLRKVNVRCFGENSGRAWVTAVGGNGGYTYTWSPAGTPTNATGDTIAGLLAGFHTVTITDSRGCTFIDSIEITQPAPLVSTMDSVDVLCFGDSTGRAWVTVSGGLPDYNYAWSGGIPVGDGDTVRNLRAGSYFVTITDDTGCVLLDTVTINQPATPVTLTKDSVNILCFGDSTGRAWVTATGGTLAAGNNYTYTWSRGTPVGIGDTVTNLSFGVVQVTVTDDNGCIARTTFNITQPPLLTANINSQNVLCFGDATGKAWVTATGGNGGYTYTWTPAVPTAGAGDTINNLPVGTYSVVVTDGNGCSTFDTVTITEPLAPLAITLDTVGVRCFGGSTGRAWATVTGGTPGAGGYTYSWSAGVPFGAGDSTLNLPAGIVSVTVTDANQCIITDSILVTEPATALTIVMDSTDASCFGVCDGKAWVTASGGTPQYTYLWANSGLTTDTISNLCPGNYVVTVTDANGCRAIDLVSVNEPDELLLTIEVDSLAYCNGNGRGQVTVSLTGGTAPYDYIWSNNDTTLASALTSNTITNVNAGSYTVTVTDANGCDKIATIIVEERTGPQVTDIDITSTLCAQPNGVIRLTVTTTDPNLDYDWSHDPLLNSNVATGLATANYTVTVTDASTCDTVLTIFVPAIDKPVVDSLIIKDSYCGNEDGVISVQVSSGVPPYTFTWSHDSTLTTNTASGLVEGVYSATVTDANGCDTSITASIVEIIAPELAVTPSVPQNIYLGQQVPIEVTLVSPIDSVFYEWLDFPGLDCYDCTNPTATPERSTTYMVRVTDNFTGCQDTAFVTIIVKDETNIFIPNAITPNGDGSNDVWVIRELEAFPDNEVIIVNRWGDVVFSASPYQNDFDGTNNGKPLPAGTYYYIIKLDNIGEGVSGPLTIVK